MDDLTCAVCSEIYEIGVREPVALPKCGHTFCRSCLSNLQSMALLFKCPTCRALHTGTLISSLPTLYLALNILDKQMRDKGTVNMCKMHDDPVRLWCRSCQKELCGQCLYEHHMGTDKHDIVKTNDAIEEIKVTIKEQVEELEGYIDRERNLIEEELHIIAIQIAKLFNKSQTLRNHSEKVRDILQISKATKQVKWLDKNKNLLEDMKDIYKGKSQNKDISCKGDSSLENPSTGNADTGNATNIPNNKPNSDCDKITQEMKPTREDNPLECYDDSSESSQDDEGDDSQEGINEEIKEKKEATTFISSSNISEWPLTTISPDKKRIWPMVNWYQFLKEVPRVQLLVPPENPEVYLQLSANGKNLGRMHIKLWGYLRRAQNFLSLCLGTFGPSYVGSKFSHVAKKGEPGERLIGGLYEHEGSYSGYQMMGGLEWRGEYAGVMRAGVIGGSRGRQPKFNSCFCISTRDYPNGKYYCPFGEVISGLEVAQEAIQYEPVSDVTITDAGLILPKHYL